MPSATPTRTGNTAALDRAVYYVGRFGSAAAALTEVECPGHDDAFDRQVNEELRGLRYVEQTAAKAERDARREAA